MVQIDVMRDMESAKEIGLITFHRTTNFGSSLQMYGLYKKIESLGYLCEVIDYRCPAIEKRENLKRTGFSLNPKQLFVQLYVRPTQRKKARYLEQFNRGHVRMTEALNPDTIASLQSRFPKLMSGSDIIWGRDITEDDYNYFLSFGGSGVKKYAFSSSVGNYDVRGDEEIVGELLRDYSQIAVREEEAITWVKRVSGVKAEWVCDPTMLLSADEWEALIKPKCIDEDYVLIYFDDDQHKCMDDAIKFAKQNCLKVKYINYGVPKRRVQNVRPTTLEDFLGLIKHANCVFTASYHGLLFSLYFHSEVMFYTRAHSTRVVSLSKQLGLEDHCGDNIDIGNYRAIDYVEVDKRMNQIRNHSIDILKGMLSE